MDRRSISFLLVGFLVGVFFATAGFAWYVRGGRLSAEHAGSKVLKLAHVLDPSHPVHKGMEFMARRAEELSGGALSITIFPNSPLGGETELIEQLQRGALAMTKSSAAPIESFAGDFAVFGVPYIFHDDEHLWSVLEGPLGRELLLSLEEHGLRGLCYYDAGARSFYTIHKPVLAPEDVKGLKIRVQQSKTAMDMVESMGGSPTPISFGELYTALQQGMVDGAENNLPSFYSTRHFEVCKHFSLDRHTQVPDLLMISSAVWAALSPQEQAWLQQAADESSQFQRELWAEETEKVKEAVRAEGVTIHEPDREPFIAQAAGLHATYEGTPVGELIERVKDHAKENAN